VFAKVKIQFQIREVKMALADVFNPEANESLFARRIGRLVEVPPYYPIGHQITIPFSDSPILVEELG
jgi:hypothetical protein